MSTATVRPRAGRELLAEDEFDSVVATVLDGNPGMQREIAERITDQALAYVATVAVTDTPIAPSRVVDEGWHALILHTRMYQRLGERVGSFVHHVPERPGAAGYSPDWLTGSIRAMRRAGYRVDEAMWREPHDEAIPVGAPAQHSPGPNCTPITTEKKPKPKNNPVSADTV